MADKDPAKDSPQPTQTTRKGAEIPVPKRDAVLRDLMKAAPPVPEPPKVERED